MMRRGTIYVKRDIKTGKRRFPYLYFKFAWRSKIQEYIQNQLQNDLEYDQMTLKEYIDPFTGEPVNQNK